MTDLPAVARVAIDDLDAWLGSLHLDGGDHSTPDVGMCVMEAVAWLAGEEHSAEPECVSPVIRAFAVSWNDSLPGPDRDRLLKPLIPDMVGTNKGPEVDEQLAWIVINWLVHVNAPAWLRLAGLTGQAGQLASLPELTEVSAPGVLWELDAARDRRRLRRRGRRGRLRGRQSRRHGRRGSR